MLHTSLAPMEIFRYPPEPVVAGREGISSVKVANLHLNTKNFFPPGL